MTKFNLKEWLKKPTVIRIILVIAVQSFLALLFDVFGLGAGSIGNYTFLEYASASNAGAFIILLYPPLLSSDGGIGVLVSRLGTALHLGSIEPKLFKNTKYFYKLLSAVLTLGTFNSLWIGLVSYITNLIALGPSRVLNPVPFIVIPIMTLTFASLISTIIASLFAFTLFKRKLNPDVYVYPTMSTVNNILSTVFYAAVIYIIRPDNWYSGENWITITRGTYFLFIPVLLYIIFISVNTFRSTNDKDFRRIIKQAIPVQTITLTINSLTGGILSGAEIGLSKLPGLFLIYPALIDTLGDEVTIVSNTTSTNLSLGSVEPKLNAIKDKDLYTNIIGVGIAGFFLHIIYGIFGSIFAGAIGSMGIVLGYSIIINLVGFLLVQSIGFGLIIFAFRKGLDPDNIVVPIVASLSNLLSSLLIFLLVLPFN